MNFYFRQVNHWQNSIGAAGVKILKTVLQNSIAFGGGGCDRGLVFKAGRYSYKDKLFQVLLLLT